MSLLDEIKKLIVAVENSKEDTPDDEKDVDGKKAKDEEEEKDEAENKDAKSEKKEDVENKCDKKEVNNAKEDFYEKVKEVYNAALKPQEENVYVSRQDKLDAAKDYFKI